MTPSNPQAPQSQRSDWNLIVTILGTGVGTVIALAILMITSMSPILTDIDADIRALGTNIDNDIRTLGTNVDNDIRALDKIVTKNATQISALTGTTSGLAKSVDRLQETVITLNQTVTDNARRIGTHTGKISGLEGSIAERQETSAPTTPTSDMAAPSETEWGTAGSVAQVQDPFGAAWQQYGAFRNLDNLDIKIAPLSDAQKLGWFGWPSDTRSNFELAQKTIRAALEAEDINISNPLWFETPGTTVTFQGWAPIQSADKNMPKITGEAADGHGVVYIPPPFGSPEVYEKFGDIKISSQDDAQKLRWFGWTSDTSSNFELAQKTIRAALEAEDINISNPLWFETPGPMAMNQDRILLQPAMSGL